MTFTNEGTLTGDVQGPGHLHQGDVVLRGLAAETLVDHDAAHRVGGAEQGVHGGQHPSVQSPVLRVRVTAEARGERRRLVELEVEKSQSYLHHYLKT